MYNTAKCCNRAPVLDRQGHLKSHPLRHKLRETHAYEWQQAKHQGDGKRAECQDSYYMYLHELNKKFYCIFTVTLAWVVGQGRVTATNILDTYAFIGILNLNFMTFAFVQCYAFYIKLSCILAVTCHK